MTAPVIDSPQGTAAATQHALQAAQIEPEGPGKARQRQRLKWTLLVLVLLAHLAMRIAAAHAIPLNQRGVSLYTLTYRPCLSYLAGRGFTQFAIDKEPGAKPVRDFLEHDRKSLQQWELMAAFQSGLRTIPNDRLEKGVDANGKRGDLAPGMLAMPSVRVLEVRLVALLWQIFGIRWNVIYGCAILTSTAACLLIFLIGRQIGGWGTGLAAAVFFTASPIEGEFVMRALRDINPLWFATLGFWATFCLAAKFRGRWANAISCVAAGMAATVGVGWRPDALIMAPFLLVFLVIRLLAERRGMRVTAGLALAFMLGVGGTYQGIQWLAPFPQSIHQTGFHIAYYGHATRANLFSLEDSFQVFRCDVSTALQVAEHARARGVDPRIEPACCPAYSARCRSMYQAAAGDRAYALIAGFPAFFYRALHGPAFTDLPITPEVDAAYRPPTKWPGVIRPLRQAVWQPLAAATPMLVLAGLAVVLLVARPTVLAAAVTCYLFCYTAVLLLVLPEYKHTGQLVLPMSLLAGVGAAGLWRLATRRPWLADLRIPRKRWAGSGLVVGAALLAWGGAMAVAYPYGMSRRAALLEEIRAATKESIPANEGLLAPQVFSVRRTTESRPETVGYLLEIETGANPGELICRHLRLPPEKARGLLARCYVTRHAMKPGRKQYFFVSVAQGGLRDLRPYVCTVLVEGDAKIVSCRQADLTGWQDLQVSTVFEDGAPDAPVPTVRGVSNETYYQRMSFDEQALTAEEREKYGLGSEPSSGMPAKP